MERGDLVSLKLGVERIHGLIRALEAWEALHKVEDAVKSSVSPLPDISYSSMIQQLIIQGELIEDVIQCRDEVVLYVTEKLLRLQVIPMLFHIGHSTLSYK